MTVVRIVAWGILLGMIAFTVVASLDRGIFEAGAVLWPHPWFRATLADAYFGFLIAWLWIAYRERTFLRRALWFVLVMGLGTIAISAYLLIRLYRMPAGSSAEDFLRRDS